MDKKFCKIVSLAMSMAICCNSNAYAGTVKGIKKEHKADIYEEFESDLILKKTDYKNIEVNVTLTSKVYDSIDFKLCEINGFEYTDFFIINDYYGLEVNGLDFYYDSDCDSKITCRTSNLGRNGFVDFERPFILSRAVIFESYNSRGYNNTVYKTRIKKHDSRTMIQTYFWGFEK